MNRAALLSLLLAAAQHVPSARILPVVTAAVRAAPQSTAPSLSTVQRMLGNAFAGPKRIGDADAEWLRFESMDDTCAVELGPVVNMRVLKLVASCRFATRDLAIDYLHQMVTATHEDWQPPVFWPVEGEMAHIGVIMKRVPVTAEAYLQKEEAGWRAAVVIAAGGRAVSLVSTPSSKAAPRSPRTSF